jgi:hypothetical protein
MGRPSSYTPEIAERICDAIAGGSNLEQLSRDPGYPDKDTLYAWLRKHKEFSDEYERARTRRAYARSDRIDGLKDQVIAGMIDPAVARVAFDMERWQAGKENPKFSEKTVVSGDPDAPLTVQTIKRVVVDANPTDTDA